MSKCDISIRFDRADRTFAGGDPVTGHVTIQVNEDVNCKGIRLWHQWKTHGRGNAAYGPKETIELAPAGPLVAGETLNFPFSLTAPLHPVTYRGHHINVDHYVGVEVDVPWAFNPKAHEEYILNGGEPPPEFAGSRGAVISLEKPAAQAGLILSLILGTILVGLAVALLFVAAFLLPIILIIAAIVWLRRTAVYRRLGEVELTMPHVIVAPGEDWPLRLRFQPRKQFRINGISVKLLCRESATSGSGTSATTHTHKVLEQKIELRPAGLLEPDTPVDQSFSLSFPVTSAYSFKASDNKIEWTAEVRIDIPRFPDWSKSQALQVVPRAFLKNLSHESGTVAGGAQMGNATRKRDVSHAANPSPAILPPVELPPRWEETNAPSEPRAAAEVGSLEELAGQLAAVSQHGHARADIAAAAQGLPFEATLTVDRVNSSLGVLSSQPGYEDGKTVIGTIAGTNQAIQVATPASLNATLDRLRRGDTWELNLTIEGWDTLYNRLISRQNEQ